MDEFDEVDGGENRMMERLFRGVLPIIRRDESSKEVKPRLSGAFRLEVYGNEVGMQKHFRFVVGINSADVLSTVEMGEDVVKAIQRFLDDTMNACNMFDRQVEMGHKYFPDHQFALIPEEDMRWKRYPHDPPEL